MNNLDENVQNIVEWAEARNLIKGSDPTTQFVKLMEEFGELAGNIARGKDVSDDIGDAIVVLTIIAKQNNLTLKHCVDVAWNDIKDRKGIMINGIFVKEADL